ncbi:MAG: response regulator [Verrucomicrobiae bacterium]|nr:response regulator [Verrucomicrobiae bacterium]
MPLLTVLSRDLREIEEEKVSDISFQLGKHVAEVMDRSARDLESLMTNPFLSDHESKIENKLSEMRRLVSVYETYSDISLYDKDGYLIESTTKDYPSHRDYTSWFDDALNGKITISQPHRKVGSEGLFLTVYLPVKSKEGEIEQVIKARLSFDRVMRLLADVHVGDDGKVVLLDSLGNVICDRDQDRLMEKFDPSKRPVDWLLHPVGSYVDQQGNEFLYAAAELPKALTHVDSHWIVLALRPMGEVMAVTRQAQATLLLATVSMVIVAVILGWFLSRRISLPLERIGNVARFVASGDLGVRASGDGSEEIDHLASSFNLMVEELGEHRDGLEKLVLSRTESLRRSQSELERTSARLQAAIDSTNNGFMVEDLDGDVAVVNRLFLDLLGLREGELHSTAADSILEVFDKNGEIPDGGFETWMAARFDGESIDCEVKLSRPDSRVLHVFSSPIRDRRGKLVGRVWNTQDLTEQRQLEESLRQSQKMEAIGQLAGGVAHDFNNLLTGILGNLSLVAIELEKQDGASECETNLKLAIKAGERAADLVRQLLGFSRRSQMDLKPCDSNIVVSEVRDILLATIDRKVRIDLELQDKPWKVMADLGLLSQVIMNMGVNAKDAMPDGGVLTLRSQNQTISVAESRQHADAAPGDYICLSVEDNGEGISPEVQKRIFEPFFTTKGPGKGTGLGLATSFGIIKQLGGWIEMDSREGEGTRFDIFLPRSAAAEAQPDVVGTDLRATVMKEGHQPRETVLVIDDEDVVRHVACTLLTKLGYQVLEANDGQKGLDVYAENRERIDLILLDLSMPNLSGRETFRRLREDDEDVPVLICSGYLVDLNEFTEECGACPNGFVQKPYHFDDMTATVRQVLDDVQKAA